MSRGRVRFDATPRERELIEQILDIIMAGPPALVEDRDRMDFEMDLLATHANGCPLDFDRLLGFAEFSFWHDVMGIARHLNRRTGELEHFFVPRCARPAPVEVER